MQLSRFRDNLSDYLENRLPASERAAMDAHLSASPDAQAELATLRSVWTGLDEWAVSPLPDAPLFFRDNVLSTIERTAQRRGYWNNDRAKLSVWERLFPSTGRLVFAAGLGGVVAVTGFLVATNALMPGAQTPVVTAGASLARVASGFVLPDAGQIAETDVVDAAPRFVISSGRTLTPDARTAYDFTFWLENAPRGSAKFTVLGNPGATDAPPDAGKTYGYAGMTASAARTLRVPFDAPRAPSALAVKVRWTAVGSAHERYLFVPTGLPAAPVDAENAATAPAPTFTTAEMPLLDVLKRVATETGTAITLEEVPNAAVLRARVSADGTESVSVALRRSLKPLGLRVSRSLAGVLVTAK